MSNLSAFSMWDLFRGEVETQLRGILGDASAKAIDAMLAGANRPQQGIIATVLGTAVLLFTALGVVVQLKDAFNQLDSTSQDGGKDATVSGGEMLVQAGGPIQFSGISAYQNGFVDATINELTSQLQHDSTA